MPLEPEAVMKAWIYRRFGFPGLAALMLLGFVAAAWWNWEKVVKLPGISAILGGEALAPAERPRHQDPGVAVGRDVTMTVTSGGAAVVAGGNVTIGITAEQYQAMLARREKEITEQINRASAADADHRTRLEADLGVLQGRLRDLQQGLAEHNRRLNGVLKALENLGVQRLISSDEARRALDMIRAGDTSVAEAVFSRLLDPRTRSESPLIAADAAYQLAELAMVRIDVATAAENYRQAAILAPGNLVYQQAAKQVLDRRVPSRSVTPVVTPRSVAAASKVATIANTDGRGLDLRRCPASTCPRQATLLEGTRVEVNGGPVHADKYTWWYIFGAGQAGWAAVADWLVPITPTVNTAVTVTHIDNNPLRLRECPSFSCPVLALLQEGTTMIVIGGPEQIEGHTWWHISGASGKGWCAVGNWLVPNPR